MNSPSHIIEHIPGGIPEHPYEYLLSLLKYDREERGKHMGYSPAAIAWIIL